MIGERIKERLDATRLSQAQLARRTGIHQTTINQLVNGKSQSSAHLHKIARELRTTVEYLEGITDDPTAEFSGDYLTEEEREWVELFRSLSEKDRAPLIAMARSLAK